MIVYIDIHTFTVQIYKKTSYSFAFLSFFRIFADDSNKEQMKKIFILLLMTFVAVIVQAQVLDIKEMPSSEGVLSLDWENKEIIAASYGYDDEGRYSFKKAYSLDGRFLRIVGEKERE